MGHSDWSLEEKMLRDAYSGVLVHKFLRGDKDCVRCLLIVFFFKIRNLAAFCPSSETLSAFKLKDYSLICLG